MATPAFIDRLNVATSAFVQNMESKGGVNYAFSEALIVVDFDNAAIAEPEEGDVVVATANIVVKKVGLTPLKPQSFVASRTSIEVANEDYDSQFVEVFTNKNRQPNFSAQSAIVIEPAPQRVFWS